MAKAKLTRVYAILKRNKWYQIIPEKRLIRIVADGGERIKNNLDSFVTTWNNNHNDSIRKIVFEY